MNSGTDDAKSLRLELMKKNQELFVQEKLKENQADGNLNVVAEKFDQEKINIDFPDDENSEKIKDYVEPNINVHVVDNNSKERKAKILEKILLLNDNKRINEAKIDLAEEVDRENEGKVEVISEKSLRNNETEHDLMELPLVAKIAEEVEPVPETTATKITPKAEPQTKTVESKMEHVVPNNETNQVLVDQKLVQKPVNDSEAHKNEDLKVILQPDVEKKIPGDMGEWKWSGFFKGVSSWLVLKNFKILRIPK